MQFSPAKEDSIILRKIGSLGLSQFEVFYGNFLIILKNAFSRGLNRVAGVYALGVADSKISVVIIAKAINLTVFK